MECHRVYTEDRLRGLAKGREEVREEGGNNEEGQYLLSVAEISGRSAIACHMIP